MYCDSHAVLDRYGQSYCAVVEHLTAVYERLVEVNDDGLGVGRVLGEVDLLELRLEFKVAKELEPPDNLIEVLAVQAQ